MIRKNIRELICQSLELNGYDPEEAQRIFLLEMGVDSKGHDQGSGAEDN